MSYADAYASWQADPEAFWRKTAEQIDWFTATKKVSDPDMGVYGR